MSDERDPRPTASTASTEPDKAAAAAVIDAPPAVATPDTSADAAAVVAAPSIPAAPVDVAEAPAVDADAAVPAIRPARGLGLAAAAGLGRLLRFAFVVALFVAGVTIGYQAHLATGAGPSGPVADPATAGNQPAPVIRELIAAVESNDADRIRSVIPAEPYKRFTSEMETWSFQEVTSVETLATFEDGTRTATAFVMIGRNPQGSPVAINLVVQTNAGKIVDFK